MGLLLEYKDHLATSVSKINNIESIKALCSSLSFFVCPFSIKIIQEVPFMAYAFGYNLSDKTERLLKLILSYRGLTAQQLAYIYFGTVQLTLSQEKSIYNDLRKLKKQSLVTSLRLQQSVSKGSLYYLTPRGYEHTKELLNIPIGQKDSGWMPSDFGEYHQADLSYDLYVPPLKQIAHHLLLLEFFTELHRAGDRLGGVIEHRHNLYAAKKYNTTQGVQLYRPDAQIRIDTQIFTIEIDRATESHEQLIQKFKTYKMHFDVLSKNGAQLPAGILFIVESKRREHGIRRRWANIVTAFFKVLYEYSDRVNLIFTTLDQVASVIEFEQNRTSFDKKMQQHMQNYLPKGYEILYYHERTKPNESVYACVAQSASIYTLWFHEVSHEYESGIYRKYVDFLQHQAPSFQRGSRMVQLEGFTLSTILKTIFYDTHKPILLNTFSHHGLDSKIAHPLTKLMMPTEASFHSFNPIQNMPVTY